MFKQRKKKITTELKVSANHAVAAFSVKFDIEFDDDGVKFPFDTFKILKERGVGVQSAKTLLQKHVALELARAEAYKQAFLVSFDEWKNRCK